MRLMFLTARFNGTILPGRWRHQVGRKTSPGIPRRRITRSASRGRVRVVLRSSSTLHDERGWRRHLMQGPVGQHDPFPQMAALMLAQGWDQQRMSAALRIVWDGDQARIDALVRQVMGNWQQPYPPGEPALSALLWDLIGDLWEPEEWPDIPIITAPGASSPPIAAFRMLELPVLDTEAMLADWLGISVPHLHWFADCDGRLARRGPDPLRHYTELWHPKRSGGRRLIEAPRPKLKRIQRRINREILAQIPLHPAATGFVRGRNCTDHAARHASEDVVVTLDLKDFFTTVAAGRVHAIFRCLGYPHDVARVLTGLVTTTTPSEVIASLPAGERSQWRTAHLAQGAPTSPALANLACNRMDRRLSALARSLNASYSRYADDLAFSGDRGVTFDGGAPLLETVEEIVRDCGFRVNARKTRIMRQGRRQQVTGIVINQHLNVPRAEFDRLKAILTNCLRDGPAGQNRSGHLDFRAHLTGKVGWVAALNPARGQKLYGLLDRIDWSA